MIDQILASGLLPDPVIRWFVRRRCRQRVLAEHNDQEREMFLKEFVSHLNESHIALKTDDANLQHYEVPTEFFHQVLGPRKKYSSCYWPDNTNSIDTSEENMLALTCERAQIEDGMRVLELGCGWGSCCLYIAEHFPSCHITAVSNSRTQKKYIDPVAEQKGLHNLDVITADMNDFATQGQFDRIMSIEMFEHMRNWRALLSRTAQWLNKDGKLFLHFFAFDGRPYFYNEDDPDDWMARNFFAGGMMPSSELMNQFEDMLTIEDEWIVDGQHYEKTLNAWLDQMDRSKNDLWPLFKKTYGKRTKRFWNNWRVFFMACAEVFGYQNGQPWHIKHYLISNIQTS